MATIWERSAHSVNRIFFFGMSICRFGCFPFWFRGQDLGSDCVCSWSFLTYYFSYQSKSFIYHSQILGNGIGKQCKVTFGFKYKNIFRQETELKLIKRLQNVPQYLS